VTDSNESAANPTSPERTQIPKSSRRAIVIGVVVVVLFIAIIVSTVVWALGRSSAPRTDPAATRAAFASAMKKAGVDAAYPPGAPIELTTVRATGGHPFSATFTGEELSALLATFSYTYTANGSSATLDRADISVVTTGTLALNGGVTVDGKSYSAVVEAPVTMRFGTVTSPGATVATVEGFNLKGDQLDQLTSAVLDYVNAYLSAAPGLRIGSARVTGDAVVVTGTAPDRLDYP